MVGEASVPRDPPTGCEDLFPSQQCPLRASPPSLTPSEKGCFAQDPFAEDPAHHQGCSGSRSLPARAETGPGDTARKRRGHSGAVSLAPPRPGSWADWRKGRKRTGRGDLSAADSQRAAANAKAKDPVGRGWAVERSCAGALGGGRHSRRGSPVGALS